MKDLPFRREDSPILDEPDFGPEVQAEVESDEDESDEELSLPSMGNEVQLGGDTTESESEEEDLPPGIWFDRGLEPVKTDKTVLSNYSRLILKLNCLSCFLKINFIFQFRLTYSFKHVHLILSKNTKKLLKVIE